MLYLFLSLKKNLIVAEHTCMVILIYFNSLKSHDFLVSKQKYSRIKIFSGTFSAVSWIINLNKLTPFLKT